MRNFQPKYDSNTNQQLQNDILQLDMFPLWQEEYGDADWTNNKILRFIGTHYYV